MHALLLLIQAATLPPAAAPVDPFRTLKGTVVDAIRDCGGAADGNIRLCPRDRGYSETIGRRLPKLVKPKPVTNDPLVTVQVSAAPPPAR